MLMLFKIVALTVLICKRFNPLGEQHKHASRDSRVCQRIVQESSSWIELLCCARAPLFQVCMCVCVVSVKSFRNEFN